MVPITLTSAIPLTSQNVTDALTSFFSVGPVLGVLAVAVALIMVPWIIDAVHALEDRRNIDWYRKNKP